jgi:hypothetical protein
LGDRGICLSQRAGLADHDLARELPETANDAFAIDLVIVNHQ